MSYRYLNFRTKALNFIGNHKKLIENFLSLSILRIVNYLLPLITLPYLVRVLGAEKFGLIAFAQAFMQYFLILTDYGFNMTITKEISINRDSLEKISEIFSATMFLKFCLMLLGALILTLIILLFDKFRSNWIIYALSYGMIIGNFLFPIWFFQGMEKMKYIAFLNIFAKVVFTVLIFALIRTESDYLYVPAIISSGFLLSGIISIYIIKRDFDISFSLRQIRIEDLRRRLQEGFYVFSSLVGSTILYASPTFFIGLALNYTIVGYYSAAERIIQAVKNLILVFSQTIFPRLSQIANQDIKKYFRLYYKSLKLSLTVSALLLIVLFAAAPKLISFLYGGDFKSSILILQVLTISLFLHSLMNFSGLLSMIILGYSKEFAYSQIIPISIFVIFALPILHYLPLVYFLTFFLTIQASIIAIRSIYLNKKTFFNLLVKYNRET